MAAQKVIQYILVGMKIKQMSFAIVPVVLVAVGALVYVKVSNNHTNICAVDDSNTERRCSEMVFSNIRTTAQRFTIKELGVSLDILPGWNVERQTIETVQGNQITKYAWTIQRPDGDGKLVLDSTQYGTGQTGACTSTDMKPAKVTSVSETENPILKYVTYTANIDGSAIHVPLIVRADEESFYRSGASFDALSIVSPGDYYVCAKGFTLPGSNLRLGEFPDPLVGGWRQSISALQKNSSDINWRPLPADSSGLSDISTMLKSIR